jgi:hypothetical protein
MDPKRQASEVESTIGNQNDKNKGKIATADLSSELHGFSSWHLTGTGSNSRCPFPDEIRPRLLHSNTESSKKKELT